MRASPPTVTGALAAAATPHAVGASLCTATKTRLRELGLDRGSSFNSPLALLLPLALALATLIGQTLTNCASSPNRREVVWAGWFDAL
jgi:hypothetical protein